MQTLLVKIVGVSPLLLHSARFANPLDPATKLHKSLTCKRKKTDEDQLAIAKSEWLGGLYYDPIIGVYLPGANVEASLFEAAKMQRLGKSSKRSILVLDDIIKLNYDGPKTPERLYEDPRFVDARAVKIGTAKLIRYRPKFNMWSAEFRLSFNPEQIEEREVLRMLDDAGSLVGVGDYRPRFGKFSAEVINE